MQRLRSIQVLRFFAALAVVICHATSSRWIAGSAGVDLFFVISGFVITLAAERRPVHQFVRDRLTRIFPIYWVALSPWIIIASVAGTATLEHTLASISLWPSWSSYQVPYLRVGWTLSFELLFYAAVALCVWRPSAGPLLLIGYGLALIAGRMWSSPALSFFGSPIILEFIAGICVAKAPKIGGKLSLSAGIILFATGAVWLSPPDRIASNIDAWRLLYWGAPAALVVYGAAQLELRGAGWRPLEFLGDASYSIYLTHLTVIVFINLAAPALVALTLTVGCATHWYIERPLLKFLRAPRTRTASQYGAGTGNN